MEMFGSDRAAGFVGGHVSNNKTTTTIKDCEFSGVLWGATSAWQAEFNANYVDVETKDKDDNVTVTPADDFLIFEGNNKITGYVFLTGEDRIYGANSGVVDAPVFENAIFITEDMVATGEKAFYYATAQKHMGVVDPAELYGQRIGVEAAPYKGGAPVYRRANADGTYFFANKAYREAVKIEIGENETTVTDNGVTYTVVRTVDQFKAMTNGAYILANDLDFNNEKITSSVVTAANIVFHGNTYTLKNVNLDFGTDAQGAALFAVSESIKVQDLNVFAKLNTVVGRTAVLVGSAVNVAASFEGVFISVDITTTKEKVGGFIGYLDGASASAAFNDCIVVGSINSANLQVAGFVGCLQAPTTFTDCAAVMDIVNSNTRVTPYVGQINADVTVTFTDCTASGTLVQTGTGYGAASFIGCTTGNNNPTIVFDGCSTDMLIVAYEQAGGFVSGPRNDTTTPNITFKNCINNATIVSAGTAGAWAGLAGAGTFTVEASCINSATVTGATIVTVSANENATAKVNDLSALNAADGSLAYALAAAQKGLDIDSGYVFGQTIGTDATPVMGGAKVYKDKDLADKDCYTNTPSFTAVEIGDKETSVTVGGVVYNVIRTADQLREMRGELKQPNTKNYILANDIDLGGINFSYSSVEGTANVYGFIYYWSGIFDGNGYSITNYSTTDDQIAFFDTASVKVDIVVKNVTFGAEDALIKATSSGAGGSAIVTAVVNNNCNVTIENVVVYGDLATKSATTTDAQKGGFVGAVINTTSNDSVITLRKCTMNGKVYGRNKIAGFFGSNYSLATVYMYDCVNNAAVTARTEVGGFMGISQVGASVYFENCVNNGKITNLDTTNGELPYHNYAGVGAIIGQTPSATMGGETTLRNCVNNGEIVGAASKTALVGRHIAVGDTVNTLTIYTNDSSMTVEKAIAELTKADNVVVNFVKQISSDIATEDDLKAALTATGVYTLTADITLSAALEANVEVGTDVTIILAGKTITGEIVVGGAGTLTIKNGTLKATGENPALTVAEGSSLKLINATVEANKTAATVTGNLDAETVTFTSATANAIEFHKASQSTLKTCTANGAVVAAADGKGDSSADQKDGMYVTIDGGAYSTITWESEGVLTVKAGTINAGTGDAVTVKNGTVTIENAVIKGANFIKVAPAGDITIIVNVIGGEFYGDFAKAGDNTIVSLSGGRYEKAHDIGLLANGYEFAKGENDTMYEIKYHKHVYSDVYTYFNTGSHKKKCTFPGCDEGQSDPHKWSDATDNGDGTHSKVCTVCNGKNTAQPHREEAVDNGDGTHSKTCKGCNLSTTAEHAYGDATSIAGNKHEKACADCGNVVTEDCTAGDDGKCSCGATIATAKKKGCKGSISGGLFVLLSVLAIPAVTVRKRKEDR